MTTFIMTGKYSADAVRRISGKRTVQGGRIIKQCRGRLGAVYATLGKTDLLVIAEFPGVAEAMKASIALNKALGISFATCPALPVVDFDRLAARA